MEITLKRVPAISKEGTCDSCLFNYDGQCSVFDNKHFECTVINKKVNGGYENYIWQIKEEQETVNDPIAREWDTPKENEAWEHLKDKDV